MLNIELLWVVFLILPVGLLIWWLHRRGVVLATRKSAYVFLWNRLKRVDSTQRTDKKTDKIWLLRATISSLLLISIASPSFQNLNPDHLVVWIDDSISLDVEQQGKSRFLILAEKLQDELSKVKPKNITIRSIYKPSNYISLEYAQFEQLKERLLNWKKLKQPVPVENHELFLSADNQWLVTDGANKKIKDWLNQYSPENVITLNEDALSAVNNVSLSQLVIRPELNDRNTLHGLVIIKNEGEKEIEVDLKIKTDRQKVDGKMKILSAGEPWAVDFKAQNTTKLVQATIKTADDFKQDNDIILNLKKQKKLAFTIKGNCSSATKLVINRFNASDITSGIFRELSIYCNEAQGDEKENSIIFHSALDNRNVIKGLPVWQTDAAFREAPKFQHAEYIVSPVSVSGVSLLSIGDKPLISYRPGQNIIDVWLSMDEFSASSKTAYMLFLNALLSYLAHENITDQVKRVISPYQDVALHAQSFKTESVTNGSSSLLVSIITITLLLLVFDFVRYMMVNGKHRLRPLK